ncbi:hypothetical protein Mgra_00005715 [Meloidogyne graminicola]|uniref:Uncharacterized protein n=1 Tax=Meloidogyne graminicola TaxID=189291 RepID=A0A8S9ZNN0_9BILA|nr:hypothetical protein Mgra_00005715 [Meloidogyne graminicola]
MLTIFKYYAFLNSTSFYSPLILIKCNIHYRSPGTNRMSGYEIKDSRLRVLKKKIERTFTKQYLQTFGLNSLENTKLILERNQTKSRFLDPKKREQLTKIYMNVLPDLLSREDSLRDVLITKLELPDLMNEIRVFWRCTGDVETDWKTKNYLTEYSEKLRKDMSETEMDQLFKNADYGADYKAISKIGSLEGKELITEEEREKEKHRQDGWIVGEKNVKNKIKKFV